MVIAGMGFADFSQPMNFPRVKLESEEGILVLGANFAAVRVAGPAEMAGGKGGIGRHGTGFSSERMVANSKSITQKRPSVWR